MNDKHYRMHRIDHASDIEYYVILTSGWDDPNPEFVAGPLSAPRARWMAASLNLGKPLDDVLVD